mgnify:CR=1 FL=1
MSTAPAPAARVALALAAVYLIWGSTYLAIRFALEGGFPPFLLGGIRFLLAGALMYALLRGRGVPPPSAAQWRNAGVLGLLLLVLGNGLVNVAEREVASGMTAVAIASAPLWMAVFAAGRGERPAGVEWLGLALGFAGVVALQAGPGGMQAAPRGMLALLVATLAWSWGSVWSRGRDLPSPFMAAAAQMLLGGAMMLVLGLLLGERLHAWPRPAGLAAFAYLVLAGSIVAYSAYAWLLRHVRPVLAGSYAYVNPAIALALGAWLAHERFSRQQLVAMAVILAGVAAISLARARAR